MLDTEKLHNHNASFTEQELKDPQYEIICISLYIKHRFFARNNKV